MLNQLIGSHLQSIQQSIFSSNHHSPRSDKTTEAIELFQCRDPLVFRPMHRHDKEMWARGIKSQTYYSFFHWSSQVEWTPERMDHTYDSRRDTARLAAPKASRSAIMRNLRSTPGQKTQPCRCTRLQPKTRFNTRVAPQVLELGTPYTGLAVGRSQ